MDLQVARLDRDLPRDPRRYGGVIDEHAAGAQGLEHAVRAEHDLREIVVVADAGDDDIGALGRMGRFRGNADRKVGIGLAPFLAALGRAVVDGEMVPGARDVLRDRAAHHAQAEEGNLASWLMRPS